MPRYVDIPTSHYKTVVLQYLEEGVEGDFLHGCVVFMNSYNYLTCMWIPSTILEGRKSDIFRPLFGGSVKLCGFAWPGQSSSSL